MDRELAQLLPPLGSGLALLLLGLLLARFWLSSRRRQRSRRHRDILPPEPLFPPPSHHQRLRDPGYLRKIVDHDDHDVHRRCA